MKGKLNANHLKLIAIIAMTIDHAADLLYPGFPVQAAPIALHVIGRITAPIMWFFICEGFYYTKNVKKYISRMLILAVISHFAYCFAFGINYLPFSTGDVFNQTSVIFPLAVALVVLYIRYKSTELKEWQKFLLSTLLIFLAFPSDWSSIAVLAILWMYKYRGDLTKQMLSMMCFVFMYAAVSFFFVNKVYALVQFGVILVWPLLTQYNGERGKAKWMKWVFYIYYPAHLIIVGIIRLLVYGDVPLLF